MPEAATDLVGIEKVSSVAYLDAIFDCYEQRRVAVPIVAGEQAVADLNFVEILTPKAGGGWFTRKMAPIHEDGPAQISLSSGTTGVPKSVQLSYRALADVVDRLIDAMGMDETISEYIGVPVTFSFGLGRVRAIAAVGGRSFLPSHGFDPLEFARMLDDGEVNALSLVPTLLRVLIANPELIGRRTGRKLQWLEIGSQPMSVDEKRAVRRMFPAARIVQHYGLTEASRTTFLDLQEATDAQLGSVGRPTGVVETKVDGEGHICIRGPHVADGILRAGSLEPIVDGHGWLRTNDLGRIDDQGFLFFLGRADDLVNVGGIKVPAELFENKLAALIGSDAEHVAVAGIADPMRGEVIMVAHRAHVQHADLSSRAHMVASDFGLGAADIVLVEVDAIPRTDTGKVQRRALSEHAAANGQRTVVSAAVSNPEVGLPSPTPSDGTLNATEAEIVRIWKEVLGVTTVSRADCFFDIGGDSLSAITVALKAEQHGMPKDMMRYMFEGRSVADIAALMAGGESAAATVARSGIALMGDTINVTRALLILFVIFSHWLPFLLLRLGSGGAKILELGEPLFHIGTPGFAMVFGVGISFFFTPMVERSPERVRSTLRMNMLILGGGVLMMAALKAIVFLLSGTGFGPTWPEELFFSVVLSYFLFMPTVPLLIRAVRITPRVVANCLTLSALSIAVLFAAKALLDENLTGFPNLARLLLITPYAYPQMLGAIGLGMAFGVWVRGNAEAPGFRGSCIQFGLLLGLVGGLFIALTGGLWANGREPHFFLLYGGILLIVFAMVHWLVETAAMPFVQRIMILVGLVSFPAYVGHLLVQPLVEILQRLGVSYVAALPVAISAFLAALGYAMMRLDRIYFPSTGTATVRSVDVA